jgi:hypothetical protein
MKMFDYNRGAKAGGVAGLIIGVIDAFLTLIVLAVILPSIAETSSHLPNGLTVVLIIATLWQGILGGLIAGGIFGIIFAAMYNKIPVNTSNSKGLVFGFGYWIIIGLILGYFISFQSQGMTYYLIVKCGLGLIIALLWGYLTGRLWDRYSGGEKQPLI